MRSTKLYAGIALLTLLCACQSTSGGGPVPKGIKIGKPYVIEGTTYYPEYDATYDRVGQASWYGPGFHGKYTANGERFDQEDLTAAHPTLPMPSLVRVTNLTNGKSAILRINDRGPFKKNRIIDLSKKSAERLGITSLAQVRVQFLKYETEQYMASVQSGNAMTMADINDRPPSAQIVETITSSTNTGQPVVDAAPVMTVNSGDLTPPPGATSYSSTTTTTTIVQPPGSIQERPLALGQPVPAPASTTTTTVVKEVWADDNVTLPDPETPAPEIAQPEPAPEIAAPVPQPQVAYNAPPPPVIISHPAPSAGGSYLIQAGSFSSEENARKLSSRLAETGKVSTERVESNGKTWWRVRLGPFASRDEADAILDSVRTNGVPDARVTRQ